MAQNSNLVLQLLITAKDDATAAFGKIFGFLDKTTSATANLIRAQFTDLFGGGLTGAIEFEAQLDKVQAKGGYTGAVMATLKKAAEDIGAQFGISGTEAAQGMESLAAAGLNAEQVMQTLPTVLNLAKAEALSFDAASALVANSLTTVGLGFDQAARLADVLTQAANESTTSASAVGKALETAGGIARASALDLEQTVAALTALAKGGIEGERAGTALAAILTQLLNPASSASKELNKLDITSRDLGTVIGELASRGDGANAAILAFGETAGPGLRALIGQGQGALTELETSMRGAGGAAGHAAEQMGGNLKTALSGLESAWESVKTALLEPVLEPLAKAANDASTALNTNLREGALLPVQAAIKAFVENSIQFAREFITSFDFKGVVAGLQELARQSADAFTAIGDYGGKAANIVQIAWNGVTATVRSIGAAMTEITASVVATLANIEEAASTVGLGSVERANALRQKAIEMQATAKELLANARQDASELGAAYDRLTTNANAASTAQQNLKDALPVAELLTLTKTLADYQGIAERANAQSAQAAKDLEAGKISAQEYGVKLLAAAEANQELADATKATAQATILGKEALDGQLNTLLQTAQADAERAEAQDAVRQSVRNLIQAEIELAQVKGDTVEVTRLQNRLADTEIEQAREVAAEKEKEAASLRAQLANRQAYRDSLKATNADLEQEIQLLIARTNAANGDAAAAQKQVEALETRKNTQKDITDTTKETTQATEENTAADEENVKVKDNVTVMYANMINYLNGARERTSALSKVTGLYFEAVLQGTLKQQGLQGAFASSTEAMNAFLNAGSSGSDKIADWTRKLTDATAAANYFERELLTTVNMMDTVETAIAGAENQASAMFYEQAIAAETLRLKLDDLINDPKASMHALNQAARTTAGGFNFIDEEDLSGLRSAIEGVNDKLREMQEITQTARERLAELNAEILEESGQDQKAALLRQQIDYQQQLAEIERQRTEAQNAGNQELLRLLTEQEKKLRTLNELKTANIQADAEAASQQTRSEPRTATATPDRGGGLASSERTYNLNLTVGNQTLRTTTTTDPAGFLAAIETAKRSAS